MKAIQSLVYSFSGINIFAKATASSMNKTAGSANKASKSLAGVHNEINNVAENNSGGGGTATPSMDLSKIDGSMTSWANKWKEKLTKFFEPVKKAWDNQGQPTIQSAQNAMSKVKESIGLVSESWADVWSNGTGQYTIELILQIFQDIFDTIGLIADAWNKAWQDDNRGTQLIQNIWDALNKLLELIQAIIKKVEEFVSSLIVQEYFKNAIDMVTNLWKALGGILEFLTGIFTGDWEKAWNGLKDFISGIFGLIWNIIKEKLLMVKAVIDNALNNIKNIWNNIWEAIKNFASNIWNGLLDKIDNIFPGMRNIIETNITNIKNKIKSILDNIKNTWSNIWNGIKTTTSNIWNGIWNVVKKPINWILSGIEKMANGVITGVNKLVGCLNNLHFTMPDWLGGGSFGINLPKMNYVSLPRLAKGNVAYSETVAVFGEYAGARNNPEITTPQNILKQTFDEVLSNHEGNNDSDRPIYLSVYVGNKKLGDILLENLRDRKRQTGKDIEALVGG